MFLNIGKGSQKSTLPSPTPREIRDNSPPMICRMVFDELCVLANGEIVCSCGDPAGLRIYGNVHKDKIADVFNGALYREIRHWQLHSRPESWCPVITNRCGGRRFRASAADLESERTVKLLQVEPTSYCNLKCLGCPVINFKIDAAYRKNRQDILPLKMMIDIMNQLPDLEKILFYNFGEPFLHKDAIPFLREVRKRRSDVLIHTNTNGLSLNQERIEIIAGESLVDQMLFSIDGSSQNCYSRYRIGGDFSQAFQNLRAFTQSAIESGNRNKIEIIWQYILFEWNDQDEEINRAKALAYELEVPIKWVITHTSGASKRFSPGSKELVALINEKKTFNSLTCDLQMSEIWKNQGFVFAKYGAQIKTSTSKISTFPGTRIIFPLIVSNLSKDVWEGNSRETYRLGVLLRTQTGKSLRELPGVLLPPPAITPGGVGVVLFDFWTPKEKGIFQLLIDIVEEDVCWFNERGSQPLVLTLDTFSTDHRDLDWNLIISEVWDAFFKHQPDKQGRLYWYNYFHQGNPFQNFLLDICHDNRMSPIQWNSKCSLFWKRIQPLVQPYVPMPDF